jgi:aldose 1-epimerase
VVSLVAPDRAGRMADVTLGFNGLSGYLADTSYFGCLVGRYANRIAKAAFSLDGKRYALSANNGPNTLHGGPTGFCRRLWAAQVKSGKDGDALELTYVSRDGEEGYPARSRPSSTRCEDGGLVIDYRPPPTQPRSSTPPTTPINLAARAIISSHHELQPRPTPSPPWTPRDPHGEPHHERP